LGDQQGCFATANRWAVSIAKKGFLMRKGEAP
jgi:hypothetical protein